MAGHSVLAKMLTGPDTKQIGSGDEGIHADEKLDLAAIERAYEARDDEKRSKRRAS